VVDATEANSSKVHRGGHEGQGIEESGSKWKIFGPIGNLIRDWNIVNDFTVNG